MSDSERPGNDSGNGSNGNVVAFAPERRETPAADRPIAPRRAGRGSPLRAGRLDRDHPPGPRRARGERRPPSRPWRRRGRGHPSHRGALRGQGGPQRIPEAAHRRASRGDGGAGLDRLHRCRQHVPRARPSPRGPHRPHGRHEQPARDRRAGWPRAAARRPRWGAPAAQPGPRGTPDRAPPRGALRRPRLHGHVQPLARRGAHHDRPEPRPSPRSRS